MRCESKSNDPKMDQAGRPPHASGLYGREKREARMYSILGYAYAVC
jgi:hypothetical protein